MSDFRSSRVPATPLKAGAKGPRTSPLTGHDRRRGVRVNSQVPVALEWDSGGELVRGEAQTRVVGPYGCMIVLPSNLDVEQRIQLTNLVSRQSNPGVVVWRGNQRTEGWELGIELI